MPEHKPHNVTAADLKSNTLPQCVHVSRFAVDSGNIFLLNLNLMVIAFYSSVSESLSSKTHVLQNFLIS